jgi:hypothetical protein
MLIMTRVRGKRMLERMLKHLSSRGNKDAADMKVHLNARPSILYAVPENWVTAEAPCKHECYGRKTCGWTVIIVHHMTS